MPVAKAKTINPKPKRAPKASLADAPAALRTKQADLPSIPEGPPEADALGAAPQLAKPVRASKTDAVIAMLGRPEGASVDEMMAATGWQRHSVRGALAGAVMKKLRKPVTSTVAGGVRRYHAAEAEL